jgi:hypothetical protein
LNTISMKTMSNFGMSQTDFGGGAHVQRRNNRLSTLISPSILAKVSSLLNNLSNFDFNIFDLNDLVESKTVFYMSYEIFKPFIETSMVEEDRFKNFITELTAGYDRKVVYHNDLHAGDVMQTLYVMILKGDIQNVFKICNVLETGIK